MKFEEWVSSESTEKAEEYRKRFKMAIANSIRRKILLHLDKNTASLASLQKELGISSQILKYHLDVLKKGECIKQSGEVVELTEEGKVLASLIREKMGSD